MLKSIKQIYGYELGASDGEIGSVKDFYFDDQSWAVRYVVAETGTWLTERQVLISPHAFDGLEPDGKVLDVNLTRKQIEKCPPIETHKTVSRQYEAEYYRYYGLPGYWQGEGLWGATGFPVLGTPPKSMTDKHVVDTAPPHKHADAHLRSTRAVTGYHFSGSDGVIGQVHDFMMDDRTWAIGQLVVKIGHRFSGREVLIPVNQVERISYEDSTVFVSLTKEAVEKNFAAPPAPTSQ
jgi:sporulation protein YlmC with PRC-barrel domain